MAYKIVQVLAYIKVPVDLPEGQPNTSNLVFEHVVKHMSPGLLNLEGTGARKEGKEDESQTLKEYLDKRWAVAIKHFAAGGQISIVQSFSGPVEEE